MRSRILLWGDSAVVQIPAPVLAAVDVSVDDAVEVHEKDGAIVIEPVRKRDDELDVLLEAMKPETFPDEVDFGPPIGGEIW